MDLWIIDKTTEIMDKPKIQDNFYLHMNYLWLCSQNRLTSKNSPVIKLQNDTLKELIIIVKELCKKT